MPSLALGLLAALAWGVHDLCVRLVAQRGGILPALATVLAIGALLVLPFAVLSDGWAAMTARAATLAALSGAAFAIAGCGLYRAFAIGPVRLVAPAVAAYPILSIGWAAASGTPVPLATWLAVLAIVAGVGVVAALSDDAVGVRGRRAALGWAALGASGFAATFALAQAATLAGAEMPVVLVARLAAVAAVLGLALLLRQGVLPRRGQLPILAAMGGARRAGARRGDGGGRATQSGIRLRGILALRAGDGGARLGGAARAHGPRAVGRRGAGLRRRGEARRLRRFAATSRAPTVQAKVSSMPAVGVQAG